MRISGCLATVFIGANMLTGCASFHEHRHIDWPSRLSSSNFSAASKQSDVTAVLRNQVSVISSSPAGQVEGLGVPLSHTRVATVAHLVDHLPVQGKLKIAYAPYVGAEVTELEARLIHVSSKSEIAILEVAVQREPVLRVPKLCRKSVGGNAVSAVKPFFNNGQLTGTTSFSGYVTNITELPLVSKEFDQFAKGSGHSPRRMQGQARVVAVSSSDANAGNSGGALYDVDQQCVLGLVSMVARIQDFASPQQLKEAIGLPGADVRGDLRPLLFSIPISSYLGD